MTNLGRDVPIPVGPVLVTGGAGYIGAVTVREFRKLGVATITLDNLSTGHRGAAQGAFVEADLGDREALSKVMRELRPAAVVHFAAKTYVGESVKEPSKYYRENVTNTWNLLEAMREIDCRDIVFSSSCATYGVPQKNPIDESHPQLPISPYGRTKLHMENMMEDYSRAYGMRFSALRYFNAAGAAQDGSLGELHDPETHLIPLVLDVARGKRPDIAIFGNDFPTRDGTCIRDYIHVEDLADAHVRALAKLQAGTERFFCNLGTGTGFSVLDVIHTAHKVTGLKIPARVVARREGDPPELICGGTRAFDELGWRAKRAALAEIIGDAWNFMQKHPRGY